MRRKGLPKRRLWKYLLALLGLLVAATILTARPGNRAFYPGGSDAVIIYVVNHGYHTELALPAERIEARGGLLAEASRSAGGAPWIAFGWGDESYFIGTGLSPERVADGLRALFRPANPSVILVSGIDRRPDAAYAGAEIAQVALSPAGFEALARSIEASFEEQAGKPAPAIVADARGVFFPSREHFSILRLCNHWTADQLSAAGLPTTPMLDGISPLLALDLRLRANLKWEREERSQ